MHISVTASGSTIVFELNDNQAAKPILFIDEIHRFSKSQQDSLLSAVERGQVTLIGVGLCGFSVGIFWPGTFSTASASMHRGGTALFALMALAGDLGCSAGPTVAGAVASALGDNLRAGILCGLGFPLLMIVGVLLMKRMADRAKPQA